MARAARAIGMTTSHHVLDICGTSPGARRLKVFSAYRHLNFGDSLELVNNQDFLWLYNDMRQIYPGDFGWIELRSGPDTWRVTIKKLGSQPMGQCCGHCQGA
jgi:uncharacterized protein (DUF2249 family)